MSRLGGGSDRRLTLALVTASATALVIVAQALAAGGLDHDFSGDGKRTLGFANGEDTDRAFGLALAPGGRIVLGGFSNRGTAQGTDFAAARVLGG